ncbi:MAG: hypothetical protein KUG65_08660 [Sphingomonadaceae bacterium]|nr:hypothetical protein [Sphingomonadaceae bacterium]
MSRLPPLEAEMAGLLDRLDPPPFSAGFADRVVAAAKASPPAALPPLRKAAWRRRAIAAIAAGSLLSVAAAAAIAPETLRKIPIIGEIVDWVIPANQPAPRSDVTAPALQGPALPMGEPLAESGDRLIVVSPIEPLNISSQAEISDNRAVAPVPVPVRGPDRPPANMRDLPARAPVTQPVPERTSTREGSAPSGDEAVAQQRTEITTEQVSPVVENDAEITRKAEVSDAAEAAPVRVITVERSDAADLTEVRRVLRETREAAPVRSPRPERLNSPRPRAEPRPRTAPRPRSLPRGR